MKPHVTITLADVVRAGNVKAAILAWAETDDLTASGVVGSAFTTSGPGSGFTVRHDADDFAQRAVEYGAAYYLDANDGELIGFKTVSADEQDTDGNWPDDSFVTEAGVRVRMGKWSDESVVRLECPDIEEATQHHAAAAAMAGEVMDHHSSCSDTEEWLRLIREAASRFGDSE